MNSCVCQSNKAFNQCCQPLLEGEKHASTPVKLMRSRYSAFALGGFGHYLKETWLPSLAHSLDAASLSQRNINWQGLEIVSNSQKGDLGVVEFKAYFLDEGSQKQAHHEVSQFQRIGGKWFYVNGKVS